jgi:hypothetical protein
VAGFWSCCGLCCAEPCSPCLVAIMAPDYPIERVLSFV